MLTKLYGDGLEARLDPKLDCTTMTLAIKGFWHEDDAPIKSAEFANALALGLACFAKYLNAQQIDLNSVKPIGLKKDVKKTLGEQLKVT